MKLTRQDLGKTVWFFDYDGSLCPHLEVWEEKTYDPKEIVRVLSLVKSTGAEVLWNTGRRVESLYGAHPDYSKFGGYFVQGSIYHPKGAVLGASQVLSPKMPVDFSDRLAQEISEFSWVRLELKPTSLRLAPTDLSHMDALAELVQKISSWTPSNWVWLVGHRGAELLAKGFDKGTAVKHQMQLLGSSQDMKLLPIAVGDDVLDRFAVEACLALGGLGVLVGDNCGWISQVKHKASQVHFCETPAALHEWLSQLCDD